MKKRFLFFKHRSREASGFTLFELIVTVTLIFFLIGTFAVYANINLRIAREQALQSELANIRMAVQYFYYINGEYPLSLEELLSRKSSLDQNKAEEVYLKAFRVTPEGFLADPFFNRYIYDKRNGLVHSSSEGYKKW